MKKITKTIQNLKVKVVRTETTIVVVLNVALKGIKVIYIYVCVCVSLILSAGFFYQ